MIIKDADITDLVWQSAARDSFVLDDDTVVPGLRRMGELSFTTKYDPRLLGHSGLVDFDIRGWKFRGYVTNALVDSSGQVAVTVKPTGRPKERKMNKPRKIVNRYYVAHPKMGDALNQTAGLEGSHRRGLDRRQWAQPTLEAAIEHAREILENNEDNQQECLIVKIVKRVRRKTAPVIVEDVRGS